MNKQGGWNFRENSLEWVGHNNMDLEYKMGKKIKSPTHINRQKRVPDNKQLIIGKGDRFT